MIHFFIGTKAQFIKTAPIMVEMQSRNIAFRYVDSGQHGELTRSLRQVFSIDEPDFSFSEKDRDIANITEAIQWAVHLWSHCFFRKGWLREEVFPGGGICLVHGDTLSTLLGLKMAKAAGLEVGHIEAGLRSYDILHPFPEELIRIHCMKQCDLLFAPSEQALENLRLMGVKGDALHVDGNTVVDALRLVECAGAKIKIPPLPYALAACHRLETITDRWRLERVVALLNRVSQIMTMVFVVHKPTIKYLEKFCLKERFLPNVQLMGMQDYSDFVALMRNAKLVMADGGSIQEECAYLNKPCLILRNKTERSDGLGRNATLWRFDDNVSDAFLIRMDHMSDVQNKWPSPASMIVDHLVERYL